MTRINIESHQLMIRCAKKKYEYERILLKGLAAANLIMFLGTKFYRWFELPCKTLRESRPVNPYVKACRAGSDRTQLLLRRTNILPSMAQVLRTGRYRPNYP